MHSKAKLSDSFTFAVLAMQPIFWYCKESGEPPTSTLLHSGVAVEIEPFTHSSSPGQKHRLVAHGFSKSQPPGTTAMFRTSMHSTIRLTIAEPSLAEVQSP
jgi:hypothetical protein